MILTRPCMHSIFLICISRWPRSNTWKQTDDIMCHKRRAPNELINSEISSNYHLKFIYSFVMILLAITLAGIISSCVCLELSFEVSSSSHICNECAIVYSFIEATSKQSTFVSAGRARITCWATKCDHEIWMPSKLPQMSCGTSPQNCPSRAGFEIMCAWLTFQIPFIYRWRDPRLLAKSYHTGCICWIWLHHSLHLFFHQVSSATIASS